MSERWGFSRHGETSRADRATIVSGFETKEAAIAHARKKYLVQAVIDVGTITRDEEGKAKFNVAETVTIVPPSRGDEREP